MGTYERHLLEPGVCKCKLCSTDSRSEIEKKDLFMQLMYLVRCKEEMELDCEQMLRAADKLWATCGLSDTNTLFGVSPDALESVGDDDFVVLIMNIMVME